MPGLDLEGKPAGKRDVRAKEEVTSYLRISKGETKTISLSSQSTLVSLPLACPPLFRETDQAQSCPVISKVKKNRFCFGPAFQPSANSSREFGSALARGSCPTAASHHTSCRHYFTLLRLHARGKIKEDTSVGRNAEAITSSSDHRHAQRRTVRDRATYTLLLLKKNCK